MSGSAMESELSQPHMRLGKRADRRYRRRKNRPFAVQTQRVLQQLSLDTQGGRSGSLSDDDVALAHINPLDDDACGEQLMAAEKNMVVEGSVINSQESSQRGNEEVPAANYALSSRSSPGIFPWIITIIGIVLLFLACGYVVISALSTRFTIHHVLDGLLFELVAIALLLWALWLYHRQRHPLTAYRRISWGDSGDETVCGSDVMRGDEVVRVSSTRADELTREHDLMAGSDRRLRSRDASDDYNTVQDRNAGGDTDSRSRFIQGETDMVSVHSLRENTAHERRQPHPQQIRNGSVPRDSPWTISDGTCTYVINEPLVIGTKPRNPFTTQDVLLWSIDDTTGSLGHTHLGLWCRDRTLFLRNFQDDDADSTSIEVAQGVVTMKNEKNYRLNSPAVLRIGKVTFNIDSAHERMNNIGS